MDIKECIIAACALEGGGVEEVFPVFVKDSDVLIVLFVEVVVELNSQVVCCKAYVAFVEGDD